MRHRTTCTYPEPVTTSYGRAMLLPRRMEVQRVHHATLAVDPEPREQRTHEDHSGNRITWFHIADPLSRLEVTAESLLSVERPHLAPATLPQLPWDQVAGLVRGVRATGRPGDGTHPGPAEVLDITAAALPSGMVPVSEQTQAFALDTFAPGQPLGHALAALSARIRHEFALETSTAVSPLPQVMEERRGACHDLAHVMLAALRSLGLAALYVSGYHEAPQSGHEGREGADTAHAWVAVWYPGAGWVHVDPTNATFVDDRYVVLSWGRDLRDVAPLRGVAYTAGGGSTVSTVVDLLPLAVEDLGARLRAAGVGT